MSLLIINMFLLLLSIAVATNSQMVEQCKCSEFEPCYAKLPGVIEQCADKCQNHFTALGANYVEARACIMKKVDPLRNTLSCARDKFGQVCSESGSDMVPKRYTETMQLAAFKEITGILNKSGITSEATGILQVGRKAIGCIVKCVQSQGCVDKKCGLALPSDNQIVSTFMDCAKTSGFLTTSTLRETCSCLGEAGLKQLTPLCPRITIS